MPDSTKRETIHQRTPHYILDGTLLGPGRLSFKQILAFFYDKNITPIFAVTESQRPTYQTLITDLGAGGGVVTLSSDSSNIVESVKNAGRK